MQYSSRRVVWLNESVTWMQARGHHKPSSLLFSSVHTHSRDSLVHMKHTYVLQSCFIYTFMYMLGCVHLKLTNNGSIIRLDSALPLWTVSQPVALWKDGNVCVLVWWNRKLAHQQSDLMNSRNVQRSPLKQIEKHLSFALYLILIHPLPDARQCR